MSRLLQAGDEMAVACDRLIIKFHEDPMRPDITLCIAPADHGLALWKDARKTELLVSTSTLRLSLVALRLCIHDYREELKKTPAHQDGTARILGQLITDADKAAVEIEKAIGIEPGGDV